MLFNVLVDPGQQRSDTSVDARILTLAATNAPGHDSHLGVPSTIIDDHGSARVAL